MIIDGRTGDSDGPLFQTDVALSPGMSLYNAIAQASIRFGVEHPCIQNPYQMEVESVSRNCYTVVNVPGLPAGRNNKWIIKIVRRRGRVRQLGLSICIDNDFHSIITTSVVTRIKKYILGHSKRENSVI